MTHKTIKSVAKNHPVTVITFLLWDRGVYFILETLARALRNKARENYEMNRPVQAAREEEVAADLEAIYKKYVYDRFGQ